MGDDNNVFQKLADRMGALGSRYYAQILENQMTEEEGNILLKLGDWETRENLAKKLNIEKQSLQEKLEDMAKRRLVLGSSEGYAAPPNIRSFPRGPDNDKTRKLWKDFNFSGDYPKILVAGWENRIKARGFAAHKVIPARKALEVSSNLDPALILWYEDMKQILKRAIKRGQNGVGQDGKLTPQGCGCRKNWEACDYKGGCTLWEWEKDDEVVQSSVAMPGSGRKDISLNEALTYVYEMEDQGTVHISPNTSQVTSTCNCCPCCCMVLHSFLNYGNVWKTLAPSRYRAVIDIEKCTGCQTCIERCHFDAIEMRKVPGSKKMKAFVINEHCMGCGLCIFKCTGHAMSLELARPPEHIPTLPMSQVTIVRSATRPGGKLYNSLGIAVN